MVSARLTTADIPSLLNQLRSDPFLLGFDHMFDRLVSSGVGVASSSTYPPYNIVKGFDETFAIEIALAGFSEDDIQVVVQEDTLTVACGKLDYNKDDARSYIHRGIARRNFKRAWTLSPTIVVTGAEFANGMLVINLKNEVPEEDKPRTIRINVSKGEKEFLSETR